MKGINQFNEGTTDQARQVAKQGLERRLRRGAPDQDFQQGTTDLRKLKALEPRQARVVVARFFAGLDVGETAESLGISAATVKRDWTFARAFLQRKLDEGGDDRAGKIIAG